jgi:hypothetical protein
VLRVSELCSGTTSTALGTPVMARQATRVISHKRMLHMVDPRFCATSLTNRLQPGVSLARTTGKWEHASLTQCLSLIDQGIIVTNIGLECLEVCSTISPDISCESSEHIWCLVLQFNRDGLTYPFGYELGSCMIVERPEPQDPLTFTFHRYQD